jgi:2-oxoisovalerate dehydrogenase E1 component
MPRDTDVAPDFTPGLIEFGTIPKFTYQSSLADELANGQMSTDEARVIFETMLWIRCFEEAIADMKSGRYAPVKGFRFVGATHLSIGQEAVAAGAISAIRPDDYITSTHRGHGHSIAKGVFSVRAMSEEQLQDFVGGRDQEHVEGLLELALDEHLHRTMAELLGKEEGYCRGRGGGMHIAEYAFGHLGANAIVGGSLALATGAAIACDKLDDGRAVLCLVGDGAANNGICHESFNMACMDQFERGTPVIYLFENNQYGMTGQQVGEVTGIDYLARRGMGYNEEAMHAEVVNGMSALAVRDAVRRARAKCAEGGGPVLLDCLTYRFKGHSLSDNGSAYRSEGEVEAWQKWDPVDVFAREMISAGVATPEDLRAIRTQAREAIKHATVTTAAAPDPDPATIYEGLLSNTVEEDPGEQWRTTELLAEPEKQKRDGRGRILQRHAVAEAIMEEMLRDRRVVLYGEDVADYGGAFGATRGLIEIFGRERVFNTAISEAAIIGSGLGAAMAGLRPIVEIMYIDFILQTMDQLANQVAKTRYMFGGKATIPLVVRTTVGGGRGYAGQHSQSLEAVITQFPGLKVVMPSTAYDLKGLLKSAIRDNDPVVFIEHQNLYTQREECPEEEFLVPLGEAAVRREGSDVTLVAYGAMATVAAEAAEGAAEEGISVELIDPRTLIPLDLDAIAQSVEKTGRLVCVTQAPRTGCYPEYIVCAVQERCFGALRAPASIVGAHDVPPPMAQSLERENLPSADKVLAAVRASVQHPGR